MDHASSLTGDRAERDPAPGCVRCGALFASVPTVTVNLFAGSRLGRCYTCGLAQCVVAAAAGTPRLVERCRTCRVPILADSKRETDTTCPACRDAGSASRIAAPTDERVVAAAVHELKAALAARCRCVTAPGLADYLDGLLRQVVAVLPGAPRSARVAIVDESDHRSWSLPDGTLVLSRGILDTVADEAELVFLLARGLAHTANGAAAGAVIAMALPSMARRGDPRSSGWYAAACDLALLGHGDAAELTADAAGFDALAALGYDSASVLRGFDRSGRAQALGEPGYGSQAIAMPAVAERTRALERRRARSGGGGDLRTNREPFRRVVRRTVGDGLQTVDAAEALALDSASRSTDQPRRWPWVALAVGGLAATILALGLALT